MEKEAFEAKLISYLKGKFPEVNLVIGESETVKGGVPFYVDVFKYSNADAFFVTIKNYSSETSDKSNEETMNELYSKILYWSFLKGKYGRPPFRSPIFDANGVKIKNSNILQCHITFELLKN